MAAVLSGEHSDEVGTQHRVGSGSLLQAGGFNGHDAREVAVVPRCLARADPDAQSEPFVAGAATIASRRRLEDPNPRAQRVRGRSERGHEPVALSLDELTTVVGEKPPSGRLELPVDGLEAGLADLLAELCGTDDVDDKHDCDVAPRGHGEPPARATCDAGYAAILAAMRSSPG